MSIETLLKEIQHCASTGRAAVVARSVAVVRLRGLANVAI